MNRLAEVIESMTDKDEDKEHKSKLWNPEVYKLLSH
jgi:hypothetical protein